MFSCYYHYISLPSFVFLVVLTCCAAQEIDTLENIVDIDSAFKFIADDAKNLAPRISEEKVTVQLYYESLCPDCRIFDTQQFVPVLHKMGSYLDVNTYPYGNAETKVDKNGSYIIECQHGSAECYGNMLHACALDILKNHSDALFFNGCMMEFAQQGRGSDDKAADVCGKSMAIDSNPIKDCAKSEYGLRLLKYYGDESKKVSYNGVPYILINGAESDGTDFQKDVCKAFKVPPPVCNQ